MLVHDFILLEVVPQKIRYSECDKSAMTHISDDFVLENWYNVFGEVDAYIENYGNLEHGLAYHGITIFTPSMAHELLARLEMAKVKDADYFKLKSILSEAVKSKKNIVHFGI